MSDSDIAEIRDLEERRYAAMKAGDIDVLEDLLHDDLAYMHSTGDLESKEGYLADCVPEHRHINGSIMTIRRSAFMTISPWFFIILLPMPCSKGANAISTTGYWLFGPATAGKWRMIGLQSGPAVK